MQFRVTQPRVIYGLAGFFSLLLSTYIVYRQAIINPDAICYVLSAAEMAQGLNAAMHLCGQALWPFYSLLTYALAKGLHVPIPFAAYALNALFSLTTTLVFIAIARELGAKNTTLILAAAVILLYHDFNSIRKYIVRDHGFWAFYLLSIWQLLLFMRQPQWWRAVLYSTSLLIATLFRIEGAIFLMLTPGLALFNTEWTWPKRWQAMVKLMAVPACLGLVLMLVLMLHPHASSHYLGRLPELGQQFDRGVRAVTWHFLQAKQGLVQHILNYDSAHEATQLLMVLLLIWYLLLVAGSLTLGFVLLLAYAWHQRLITIKSHAKLVLTGYIVINILITFGFLLREFYLSKRYLLALSLTLLCFAPLALEKLSQQRQDIKPRLLLSVIGLCLVISACGGIFDFGYSKAYIHQAGDWLKRHVRQHEKLYSNDIQVLYYSAHEGAHIFEQVKRFRSIDYRNTNQWQAFDYVALRLDKQEVAAWESNRRNLPLQFRKEFSNKRGDKVVIFKVNH